MMTRTSPAHTLVVDAEGKLLGRLEATVPARIKSFNLQIGTGLSAEFLQIELIQWRDEFLDESLCAQWRGFKEEICNAPLFKPVYSIASGLFSRDPSRWLESLNRWYPPTDAERFNRELACRPQRKRQSVKESPQQQGG